MIIFIIVLILAFATLAVLDVLFQKKQDAASDCFLLFGDSSDLGIFWVFAILTASSLVTELAAAIFLSAGISLLWEIVGSIIAVCGGIIFYLGLSKRYYSWWTTNLKGNETELVTDGIFSYSQNPDYLGTVLFLGGIAVALQTLYVLPFVIGAFITGLIAASKKEKDALGYEPYAEYAKRVHTIWGKKKYPLTLALSEGDGEFSDDSGSVTESDDDEKKKPDIPKFMKKKNGDGEE